MIARILLAAALVCLPLAAGAQDFPTGPSSLADASAIDYDPSGSACVGTNVQDALTEACAGGGGGGTNIILDFADDGSNESSALAEIAFTNILDSVVTEPSADKLLLDFDPILFASELNSEAELESLLADVTNVITEAEIDSVAKLETITGEDVLTTTESVTKLSDVDTTGVASGDAIVWNGSNWVDHALVAANRVSTVAFSQLSDLFAAFLGDRMDACRYGWGWLKGGGYDAATNRYAWTCYYPWTVTHGDDSGSYDSPTNAGVDSAYEVDCTGVYDPDSACVESGEHVVVNATPNIALSVDFTADGGHLYLPVKDGEWFTGYSVGLCGAQADGTANECPILRPPNDTFNAGQIVQTVRGITIHLEGEDGDGIQRVVDGSGRPRRTGSYLLLDSGHDIGGYDPGAGSASTRRQTTIGLAGGLQACGAASTPGVCSTSGAGVRGIPENASVNEYALISTPTHADQTWCIDDRIASNRGVCDGDIREGCSTNSDCTSLDAGWSCIGGATLLAQKIADAREPVSWGWKGEMLAADGSALTVQVGGLQTFESVDTGTPCGGGNEGHPATLFDATNPSKSLSLAEPDRVLPLNHGYRMHGGGIQGGTIAPANSSRYKVHASEVFGDGACDAAQDGSVVLVVDDDGSCSETANVLDGGGSTMSECLCDFSGTGTWAVADCGTVPGSGGHGDKRGCNDDSAALTYGSALEFRVKDVHVTGFDHIGGNPIFDAGAGVSHSVRGRNIVEDSQFTYNTGRIVDLSSGMDCERCLFADNDATGGNLVSLGFSGEHTWRNNRFHRNVAGNLISIGEGQNLQLLETELIGNETEQIIYASEFQNVLISGIYGYGNNGALLHFQPEGNDSVFGRLELSRANLGFSDRLQSPGGLANYESVIRFIDRNNNENAATWLGPFIFRDLHFETEAPNSVFLAFDGTNPDDGTSNIDEVRSLVTVADSSIMNERYGGTAKMVCVRDDGESGPSHAGNCEDIWRSRFVPRMVNNRVNGVGVEDYPYTQVAAAEAGDCTGAPSGNGEVPPGAVVAIHDDTSVNTCDDTSPADGVLDGGGTSKSVCMCGAAGWTSF